MKEVRIVITEEVRKKLEKHGEYWDLKTYSQIIDLLIEQYKIFCEEINCFPYDEEEK